MDEAVDLLGDRVEVKLARVVAATPSLAINGWQQW